MTDTPGTLIQLMSKLVDDSNPYRTHNAISLFAALMLGVCTLIITLAALFMSKSLSAELFTLVTALAGLAGYQFAKGSNSPYYPPPPTNNPNLNQNNSNNNSQPPIKPPDARVVSDDNPGAG